MVLLMLFRAFCNELNGDQGGDAEVIDDYASFQGRHGFPTAWSLANDPMECAMVVYVYIMCLCTLVVSIAW